MRASMLLITFLCPVESEQNRLYPRDRPPGCPVASGVLQGIFVAIGNRKLMFLTKYSLPHTFFIARLWSKMCFLDEDCKPQMISGTSLHRQHEKTKCCVSLGISYQYAAAVKLGLICKIHSTEVGKLTDSFPASLPGTHGDT